MKSNKNVKNTKGKKILNEKYCAEKYSSYNQITKEFDVYILSNEEYDKLPEQDKKEVKFVVVKKKANGLPPDPTKPPIWFSYWVENEFRPFKLDVYQRLDRVEQEVADVKQEVKETNARIDNLVKKNNLKE